MPRLWRDKTTDELREEWQALIDQRDRIFQLAGANMAYDAIEDAIEAIELEIGRRKVPLVDAKD